MEQMSEPYVFLSFSRTGKDAAARLPGAVGPVLRGRGGACLDAAVPMLTEMHMAPALERSSRLRQRLG